MHKKGQVTLFVIIAIMLVAAVALVVYFAGIKPQKEAEIDIKPIQAHVQNCVESTAENGLYMIGFQGGYIITPANSLETNFTTISYGYSSGKNQLPAVSKIESELKSYIELFLPSCTTFDEFPDLDISTGEVDAVVNIKEDTIDISVNYPITIKKEATYALKDFDTKIYVRLGRIHTITGEIINNEEENPGSIDLSYLIEVNTQTGIKVDVIPYDNTTLIYSIKDPLSKIENRDYVFMFANSLD